MLSTVAFVKSVTVPIVLATLLVAFARRSANPWYLLASFLAGILGAYSVNDAILRALPALTPAGTLQVTTVRHAWLSGFLEAALPEELSKGLWLLVLMIGWQRYSSSHGTLIGGLIGLGFALRENLTNALAAPEWRATAALSHGAWGIIMGHLFQKAAIGSRWHLQGILWGFIPPVLLHGLADASVFLVEAYESKTGLTPTSPDSKLVLNPVLILEMLVSLSIGLFSWIWGIRLIRAIRQQPVGGNDELAVRCASGKSSGNPV